MKKVLITIIISISFFVVAPLVTQAEDGICFKPMISIPGFGDGFQSCAAGTDVSAAKTGILINSKGDAIALYINALYKYAAGAAGAVAMFMIVFAAWQWVMASGNAGKIDNAKDTIRGALLGLTLLFAGNLLLTQISSGLVKFDGLEITSINTKKVEPPKDCASLLAGLECNRESHCAWLPSTGACYTSNDVLCSTKAPDYGCNQSFVVQGNTCVGGLRCSTGNVCGYRPGGNSMIPPVPCSYGDIKNGKECSCYAQ
jgi:hypothetical protein